MDPIILIFVAITTACLGFLLGFMVRTLTHRGTKSKKAPSSKKPTKAKKPPKRNWIEVANLWRDRSDGGLIFQIEDQYYKRGDELTTREREILLKVVMGFYRWLEPASAVGFNSKAAETPGMDIESKPGENSAIELPPPQTSQDVFLEEQASPHQEIKPPTGVVGRALGATITAPDTPTLSVVAQVDSILQEKLQAANMQQWAVRLTESADAGMTVWVGMERYEALDEVPYQRVRAIISASVAEWERRSEAGDTI